MKRTTCVRGALLIALLALTSFASSVPPASASTCATTCCRCLNRCEVAYQRCLTEATTSAEELACYIAAETCDDNCYNGPACGGL